METRRAWLVLALGDAREYRGNEGYADELESVYRYDSFVPNHKQIAQGDLLILRNGKAVLGSAVASRIVSRRGAKTFKRCPTCRTATIKERKLKDKDKKFKCRAGHEFASPDLAKRKCTHFAVHFDGSYRPMRSSLSIKQVHSACLRYNGQLAMQELSLARLPADSKQWLAAKETRSPGSISVGAELMAYDASDDPYVLDDLDERKVINRQIKERRGQKTFREKLRARYRDTCLVTGCVLVDLLEACHISPHRGAKDNHPSNGLLLRTDIHTLFDLDLLGIEPDSLLVHIQQDLKGSEYGELEGRRLECDPKLLSRHALESRWDAFVLRRSRSRQ